MYSSDDSDEGELSGPSVLYRSPVAGLKPALDSIFSEVQANIPIIGSDSESEVNSDEEPVIFHRSGDLPSLSPSEDLSLGLTAIHKELEKETSLDDSLTAKDEGRVSLTSSDSELSLPSTFKLDKSYSNQVFKVFKDCSDEKDIHISPEIQYDKNALDSKQAILHLKTTGTLSTGIQAEMDEPKAISSVRASSNHSHDSLGLSFSQLSNIDFDDLMKRVSEVTVSSWSGGTQLDFDDINNNDPDSDSDTSNSSDELMRQLVNLSQRQQDEAITVIKNDVPTSAQSPTDVQRTSKSKEFGIQADISNNDAGTMFTHFTSSVGVSASFGSSSHNTGFDLLRRSSKTEERGTVFIDLRNQKIEPNKAEKASSLYSSSIQRILGINDTESSSSSSEDEHDLELWHEQRKRIKQGLAARNQAYGTNTVKTRTMVDISSVHAHESLNTASYTKMSPTTLDEAKTIKEDPGLVEKAEKRLEIKVSDDQKKYEMGKEMESKDDDDDDDDNDDEYIMINIEDSSTNTRVAEFVSVPSLENKDIINTPSPKPCATKKKDDSRTKEVNKRIATMILANKDLKSETVVIGRREAWVENEKEERDNNQKKSLAEENIKKLDEERTVKEDAVATAIPGISADISKNSKDNTIKVKKQYERVKESENKKKESKSSMKDNEERILNEKIKAKKLRIQHRLESVKRERESRTVGGRVCIAAPKTPIVFDADASYEPQPTSLPEIFPSKNYLLLSVSLSTCGELSLGGNKGSKVANRGLQTDTDCHCFNTLIAWLLSMVSVPQNTLYQDNANLCDAPFNVIGLQQTWHEGELSVKVGICSRYQFQGGRAKQGGKGNNFQLAVAKFLRTNTLCSVLTKIVGHPTGVINMSFSQKNLSSLLTINPDPQAMIRVFGAEPGFYWKTHEVEDTVDTSTSNIEYSGPEIENTLMLVQFLALHDPSCMFDILNRIWREGLDLAGFRLLYTQRVPFDERRGLDQSSSNVFPHDGPLLALAIRGPYALSRWLDAVGPKDTWLARRTDPTSLRAVYGAEDKDDHLFYSPRNAERANTELARWFGGRVPPGDALNIGSDDVVVQRPRSGSRGRKEEQLLTSALHTPLPFPPCTLVAATESLVVIVTSPLILPRCFGILLAICNARGFTLQGIRRIRFHPQNQKDSSRDTLGFTAAQLPVFCPSKSFASDQSASQVFVFDGHSEEVQNPFSLACTVFCLRKENGMHHVASLVTAFTEQIALMDYLPREVTSQGQTATSKLYFAVVPYSEHIGHVLGSKIKQAHNSNIFTAASLSHSFYSNPELEQVCVLTLLKEKATKYCYDIIDRLTLDSPRTFIMQTNSDDLDNVYSGFELLGIKLVSSMTMHQAKEFTPYEIGDKLWQSSLKPLTSGPALVCALRGVNAFERLRHFIHSYYGCSPKKRPLQNKDGMCPDIFMSSTPEIAYRQLTAIFFEHELHADHSMRTNQHHLPWIRRDLITCETGHVEASPKQQKGQKHGRSNSPARANANTQVPLSPDDVPIIASLLAGPCLLTTVCVIKPDAVPKHMGKVLKRLTREGFNVVNMRMNYLTEGDALAVVLRDWECLKEDQNTHVKHLTSGPVVLLSLQRENAVGKLLDVLGPSNPDECRQESQFYLRGSYGLDRIRNALYGSCSYKNAVQDHKLLFAQGVCCSPTLDLKAEGIPCLVSDKILNTDTQRILVDVPEDSNSHCSTDNEFSTVHLPPSLLEVNCILLLPNLLKIQGGASSTVRSNPGFTEVIDGLVSVGLQIVGLRMMRLNDSQAAQCTRMYGDSIPADVKPHQMASQISQGPCIVMAVVRDGAVTSFDMLLGNPLKSNSLATRYGKYILAARSFKKARRLVECFFDHLMPNKKSQIECKDA